MPSPDISKQISRANRAVTTFQGKDKDLQTAQQISEEIIKEGGAIGIMFAGIANVLRNAIKINSSSGGSGGNVQGN